MNELLKAALESFPNFVIVNTEETVSYINESYAQLLGTTAKDAVGRPVRQVIPNTRLHIVLKTGRAEVGSVMTLYDHRAGKNITLVCNRLPVEKNGKVIGAIGATTINNIFDATRLNQELEAVRKENRRYREELQALKSSMNPLEKIAGTSAVMEEVKGMIAEYAKSNLAVLITGETGVGKEVFARALHQLSGRANEKYIKINCAAIPASLLESELFGYADGAFSGAAKGGKPGKFELANGGTLLLDEIGEMPPDLQTKLLRVLQEKEIERVGGTKPVKLDVRIVCSTNENLRQLIQERRFREDLFYRINVVELRIPPLRERLEDIPALCSFFIDRINQENGYAITEAAPGVLELFRAYPWPGNVRELEHVMERAAVRCKSGPITPRHVDFLAVHPAQQGEAGLTGCSLRECTQQAERESILQALEQAGGNKTRAAQLLGIDRSRLYSKLRKYGL